MRSLIASPLVVILIALLGVVLCKALGVVPDYRQATIAGVIVLAASVLGVVPLVLTRGAKQYAVSQAGLVGTVLHLFTAIGAGGMVYLTAKPGTQFLYWLAAMYWASLLTVVVCSVQAVKSAEPETRSEASGPKPAAKD